MDGDVGGDLVDSPRYVGDDGGDLVESRRVTTGVDGGDSSRRLDRGGDTVDSRGDVGGDVLDFCSALLFIDSRGDNGADLDFSRRSFNFLEDPRIGVAADAAPGEIGHC